jgi:hypothetical protein
MAVKFRNKGHISILLTERQLQMWIVEEAVAAAVVLVFLRVV